MVMVYLAIINDQWDILLCRTSMGAKSLLHFLDAQISITWPENRIYIADDYQVTDAIRV